MPDNLTPSQHSEEQIKRLSDQVVELQRALDHERGQTEKLHEAEDRFRILSSVATEGVMIHVDHVILDANQAFADILGFESPQDLIGRNGMEVVRFTTDSRQRLLAHIQSGSTEAYPIDVVRQDGTVLAAETHGRAIEYRGHQARLVFMRDISQRKRAEDALAAEKRFAEALFESLPGVIYAYDEQGRLVRWNRIFESVFGPKTKSLTLHSLNVLDTIAPEDRDRIGGVFSDILEQGHGEAEFVARTADGRNIPYFASARLAEIAGARYVVGAGFDISQRVQTEAEREKLQQQLQHSMKMEAVGQLAGGVAHDFNNLLTVITGNVDLAEADAGASNPLSPYLKEVSKAAASAANLTHQLLAFSRRQILESRVLDLNQLVALVQKMLTRLIGENIEIGCHLDGDLGLVKVDPTQFEQVLVNLAVNARDAMPDGGKLTITTANIDLADTVDQRPGDLPPGRYVQLTVTDTGQGMSDEVKLRAFEPFFTTKLMGRGTGLGLATTFGAVQQAGGAIEVDSNVGRGTRFQIYLPRLEGVAMPLAQSPSHGEPSGGTETVLLVEDDESVRELTCTFLRGLGYEVLLAVSGVEAVEMAAGYTDRIDLLLTDLVMPGLGGRETAEKLLATHPDIRVLFMSGYTDDLVLRRGVVDDNLSFIAKPFNLKNLAAKLREVVDRS